MTPFDHSLKCSGQLDEMLQYFGIEPVVPVKIAAPKTRARREYRGDRRVATLNRDLIYNWMPTFESMVMAQCNVTCNAVFDKYETAVNRYGYSLKNMKRVVPTPFLREFMLPATSTEE